MRRTEKQKAADDIDRLVYMLMGRAEQAKLGYEVQRAFREVRVKVRQHMHPTDRENTQ